MTKLSTRIGQQSGALLCIGAAFSRLGCAGIFSQVCDKAEARRGDMGMRRGMCILLVVSLLSEVGRSG